MRRLISRGQRDWHDRVLVEIAAAIQPRCYVEIGIYRAQTLNKISAHCGRAIGVDIDPAAGRYVNPRRADFVLGSLSESTSRLDDALARIGSPPIDMAFIDGDHRSEAALKDFRVIAERASESAVIALHDTWPRDKEQAEDRFCSDSYRLPALIAATLGGDWSSITIPVHPGLTLCSRTGSLPAWLR